MQEKFKIAGWASILILTIAVSCSDDDVTQQELSDAAKQYLSMRMGSNTAMSGDMAGPINRSFGGLFSSGITNGRIAGDSTGSSSDTTIIEDPWKSCAIITEIDNEDGSHTTIYDYGDGCEEGWEGYKYFMHGKVTSTYRNQYSKTGSVYHDSYYYASEYDNYGGNYNGERAWVMDGGRSLSG